MLPAPPVPSDLRVRAGSPFLLDAAEFLAVDVMMGYEARCAAMTLRAAAWREFPAGSLPADRSSLARAAGYGHDVVAWDRVSADALDGWLECRDGRWYHLPTCMTAMTVARADRVNRDRTAAARAARAAARSSVTENADQDLSSVTENGARTIGERVSVTENAQPVVNDRFSVTEIAQLEVNDKFSVTENAQPEVAGVLCDRDQSDVNEHNLDNFDEFLPQSEHIQLCDREFEASAPVLTVSGGEYKGGLFVDGRLVDGRLNDGGHHPLSLEGVQGEDDHPAPGREVSLPDPAIDRLVHPRDLALPSPGAFTTVADTVPMEWPEDAAPEPQAKPAKARRKPATTKRPCAEDEPWTDAMARHAAKHAIPEHLWPIEFERFRAHHLAKGTRFTDWDRVWLTWCLNGYWKSSPEYRQHLRDTGCYRTTGRTTGLDMIGDAMRRAETATTRTETDHGARPQDRIDWDAALSRDPWDATAA